MNLADASVFQELAVLLAIAAAIGIVGLLLRQPLIVAFIATGIIVGGDVLGVIKATEQFDLLAEVGISVLLFLVGLKLDIQIIRSLGKVAVATGLGQVAFTAIVGFFICLGLGLDATTSAYVAVALTFSSTIIIVKLLSDKRELDTLHGRIAVGFLIVQDIVVVAAMVVLSAVGVRTEADPTGFGVAGVFASGLVMLVAAGLFIRYVAEPLTRLVARIPELLVVFALAWAVLFAAAGDWLGFGKELVALLRASRSPPHHSGRRSRHGSRASGTSCCFSSSLDSDRGSISTFSARRSDRLSCFRSSCSSAILSSSWRSWASWATANGRASSPD